MTGAILKEFKLGKLLLELMAWKLQLKEIVRTAAHVAVAR